MAQDGLARQNLVVGSSTALTTVSGKDDYAMVAALVFTLSYLATICVLRANGMGYRGAQVSFVEATRTLQTTYAIEIVYYLSVNAIKISILFFYLRIGTISLLVTFGSVCIIVILMQCRPLHKMWDLTGMVPGTCINTSVFIYTTSATNIVIDIWILLLPIKLLLSIQRPGREKSALVAIFALGALSCIASIVRLYSVHVFTVSHDPFYDSVPINTWSMIEIHIGIWCASIPALKALCSRAQRAHTQLTLGHGYQYHGSERSAGGGGGGSGRGPSSEFGSLPEGGIRKDEEFILEEICSA
ncbi:hypothetical protein ACEQ8H_004548 [Pleosporales sp. CAS-2024a]